VANVEVHCGRCGHLIGVGTEVDEPVTSEVTSTLLAELVGRAVRCDRCGSVLDTASGQVLEDSPLFQRATAADRISRSMRGGTRWAVGSKEGPRSAVWRIWANRNDVYLSARYAASDYKVSLHASGKWRVAFTEHHLTRPQPLLSAGSDRALDRWDRPDEFAPGWTRAFLIMIPVSEVVPPAVPVDKPDEVVWIEPPPLNSVAHFDVVLSAPDARGARDGRGFAAPEGYTETTEVVTLFDLPNGERVWLLLHAEPTDAAFWAPMDEVRARMDVAARSKIAAASSDDTPHDLRAIVAGVTGDGVRFFIDLALT